MTLSRIFPIWGWANTYSQKQKLFNEMKKFTPNHDGIWNNIILTDDKNNVDYFIIFSHCNEINFDISKTIVFETEPKFIRKNFKNWNNISKSSFFKYYGIEEKHTVQPKWNVGTSFNDLLLPITKTKILSTIMSGKCATQLQRNRLYICRELDKLDYFDCYGREHINGIKKYKGQLPNKTEGLMPYKYSFHCENCREINYFTEKLTDCILSETLCFYDGCPNIDKFINSDAFIRIDADNIDKSFNIIKSSINNNEWEKRLEVIRKEKKKIMYEYNPLNIVNNILEENQCL